MSDSDKPINIPGEKVFSHLVRGEKYQVKNSFSEEFPTHIEIRRSARRRKTISGRIENDRIIVMVPAHLTPQAEERAVASIVEKLRKQHRRKLAQRTMNTTELGHYVSKLDHRYCQGKARPAVVEWSRDVATRWGSCHYRTRTIQLHPALATMPRYVLDYVIVHELCHLTVPGGHTDAFWEAVSAYPKVERARGYLDAASRYETKSPTLDTDEKPRSECR